MFGTTDREASDQPVLFLYIDFSISLHDILGYIALMMDIPSLAALKTLPGELVTQVVGLLALASSVPLFTMSRRYTWILHPATSAAT